MIVPEPALELNKPVRTVLWQGIALPGSEWCAFERDLDGWRLHGIVLTEVATAPVVVHYAVGLATDWSTRDSGITDRIPLHYPAGNCFLAFARHS